MATIFSTNFDADTPGQLAPGWEAKVGTWAVGTTAPVSGARSFGATSNADGDFAMYTGAGTRGDAVARVSFKVISAATATNGYYLALRMDAGYLNGYLFAPDFAGNALAIFKRSGGGYAQVKTVAFPLNAYSIGDTVIVEASAVGSALEMRVWRASESRPATASLSHTDASYTTGYPGVYRAGVGQTANAIDDFLLDDTGAAAPAYTSFTLSGPTTGTVGIASSNFTVALAPNGGTIAGNVTITPSDGGAGGTFSPTTLTLNNSTPSATFTYTAASTGAKSISATDNAGLTDPSAVTYTAAAAGVTFPVTNANVYFSPYNWYSNGGGAMAANNVKASSTFAWCNMRGGYLKFKATVGNAGTIALGLDTSTLASVTAGGCPQIAWMINGTSIQSQLLASGQSQLQLASALAAGTYEVFVWFRGVHITQDGDTAANYSTVNNKFHVTSVLLSAGGTLSAPTVRSKKLLCYGDSITEGDLSNGGPRSASSQDTSLTYPWLLAEALNAEVGIVGFYGQAWSWFSSSWSSYASGMSRLVGGLLTPAPDYITINYGENDGNPGPASATVTTTLAAVAAAAPTAKVILLIPFSGRARTNLAAATLPANGYRVDTARIEMLPGNMAWSYDGQHPNQRGHANEAAILGAQILALGDAALVSRTVSITLEDGFGPLANLTGLKVAFYDQGGPDTYGTVRYQSSTEATDGAGVLTFPVSTSLAPGQSGSIVVRHPDGRHFNGTAVVS